MVEGEKRPFALTLVALTSLPHSRWANFWAVDDESGVRLILPLQLVAAVTEQTVINVVSEAKIVLNGLEMIPYSNSGL